MKETRLELLKFYKAFLHQQVKDGSTKIAFY
jgi:hypothetical protein